MTSRRGQNASPSKGAISDRDKLDLHNIKLPGSVHALRDPLLPPDLRELLQQLGKAPEPCSPDVANQTSPRAGKIVTFSGIAAREPELDATVAMSRHLWFQPPIWEGEHALLHVSSNAPFIKGFLPQGPPRIKPLMSALQNPQPDVCYGYCRRKTSLPDAATPLSRNEELLLASHLLDVSHSVALPFFTAQAKSPVMASGSGGHPAAVVQSARDGAAVVNSNCILLDLVGIDPSPARTCHFSSTCDMQTVQLYVHWRQQDASGEAEYQDLPEYRMALVKQIFLDDKEDTRMCRRYMRNIYKWAVGERLAAMKEAVGRLENVSTRGPGRPDDAASTTTGTGAEFVAPSGVGSISVSSKVGMFDQDALRFPTPISGSGKAIAAAAEGEEDDRGRLTKRTRT